MTPDGSAGLLDPFDPRTFDMPEWEYLLSQIPLPSKASRVKDPKVQGRVVKNLATQQIARMIAQALAGGGRRLYGNTFEWDVSKGCQLPFRVVFHTTGIGGTVELLSPCRSNCEVCLRDRSRLWRRRATVEGQQATRNWLVTLTLSPDQHYKATLLAERKLRHAGVTWAELPPGRQFAAKANVVGAEVQKWLKRVRKRCTQEWPLAELREAKVVLPATLIRYLLVVEQHVSGEPHWHLLLHEQSEWTPIRHDWLNKAPRENGPQVDARWPLGFASYKLIPAERCTYVAKYLSKSLLVRVRASKRYGELAASAGDEGPKLDHHQTKPSAGTAAAAKAADALEGLHHE